MISRWTIAFIHKHLALIIECFFQTENKLQPAIQQTVFTETFIAYRRWAGITTSTEIKLLKISVDKSARRIHLSNKEIFFAKLLVNFLLIFLGNFWKFRLMEICNALSQDLDDAAR